MNENDFLEMVKTSFGPAKIERNTYNKKRDVISLFLMCLPYLVDMKVSLLSSLI